MIRITGGKYKGRPLKLPRDPNVRPTRSMVREAIFDILGPDIVGATVLDLFSGSGLLGIEAISRGAGKVFFVERDKLTCKILRHNLRSLEEGKENLILCIPAHRALKRFKQADVFFDIILMDPPYSMNVTPALNKIASTDIVKPEGKIILERSKHALDTIPKVLSVIKRKTYGYTQLIILQPITGNEERGLAR